MRNSLQFTPIKGIRANTHNCNYVYRKAANELNSKYNIHTHIHTYTCTHTHIHIYTYTQTHMHTYTDIQTH